MLKKKDGELRIAYYGDDEPELNTQFPHAKVQFIKNFLQPFRALPRDNDIVILKDLFHLHHNQDLLLKVAYTTLANTAEIIIMQEKGTMDIEAIKEMLEKYEFRAANYIDVLPEYDLVMAKKMHMWGNGL
jgi:predicted nicotinamide N-methyase